ncbi:MAG: hypothetical protein M1334_02000 [Patescibacteria group bacterium]|nr:hypothetical protein [Patescibacteria group bacterium]
MSENGIARVNNIDKSFKRIISTLWEHKLIPSTPEVLGGVIDANAEISHKESALNNVFMRESSPINFVGIITNSIYANGICRLSMSKFVRFQWGWNSDAGKVVLEMHFYGNIYGGLNKLERIMNYKGSLERRLFLIESGDWRVDGVSIYNFNGKGSHIKMDSYNGSVANLFDKLGL